MSDEIGKWYESKRLEAVKLQEEILSLKENVLACNIPFSICLHCAKVKKEIRCLEQKLESARYVGD